MTGKQQSPFLTAYIPFQLLQVQQTAKTTIPNLINV